MTNAAQVATPEPVRLVIEKATVLVTGGASFIGSALVDQLVDANKVVVFDNGRRDALSGTRCAPHPILRRLEGGVVDLDRAESGRWLMGRPRARC